MAGPASDYHRGEMNIQEQVSTFHLVMGITKWGSLSVAVGLLFLTLWFCTDAGFMGALVSSVVLLVIGVFALRSRPDSGH